MATNFNFIVKYGGVFVISIVELFLVGCAAGSFLDNNAEQNKSNAQPESEQIIGIDLDILRDEIQIFFLNPTNLEINVIDTINIKQRNLPPSIYFKIVELKSMDSENISDETTDQEWVLIPNYNSYSFPIPSEPINLKPGEYLVKSWRLNDILGRYVDCEEEQCRYLVKFKTNTFLSKPPNDPVEKETPWILYKTYGSIEGRL